MFDVGFGTHVLRIFDVYPGSLGDQNVSCEASAV